MNFKDKVNFPFLVHRFENLIEEDISNLRTRREEIATRLKRLRGGLSKWDNQEYSVMDAIEFVVRNEDYKTDILGIWGISNEVDPNMKIEKYVELYDVPDFSQFIEDARFLRSIGESTLLLFVGPLPAEVAMPVTTKEEKEKIVETHSFYVHTQKDYDAYVALTYLCEAVNIINYKWTGLKTNKVQPGSIKAMLPSYLGKFIETIQPEEGNQLKRMVINFQQFKEHTSKS